MFKVQSQRKIFDRRVVQASLSECVKLKTSSLDSSDKKINDVSALEIFKSALKSGQKEIENRIKQRASGQVIVSSSTFLIDQLIRTLFDYVTDHLFPLPNPTKAERLTLVSLGGYGRGEMAPHSDVDLMFLYPWKFTSHMEQVIESVLYMLWDMGLNVGHSTRSVEGCLKEAYKNYTIRTSVLEARYIWGDQKLYRNLHTRFHKELIPGTEAEFIKAKLNERDSRHERLGDSRYFLEPNIKDGKGGLRDLHTLFWIAKYLYLVEKFSDLVRLGFITHHEHQRFVRAENFLWRVRAQMHVVTGRAQDHLTFDIQSEIAKRMGYSDRASSSAVERFMKHYFIVAKTVGELTRIFCSALEAERLHLPPGFEEGLGALEVDGIFSFRGRLKISSESSFIDRPARMVRIFRLSQTKNLDIHPQTLRQLQNDLSIIDKNVRDDPEVNKLFLDILMDQQRSEATLRRMNESGVLGRLIPEFGRVVAQTQHDMYHVYTVDEHTIRAVGVLSQIERGEMVNDLPLASELISKILSRTVLYVAIFLHDIAKGRNGDHSEMGSKWALKLCPRFGLTQEETDTVCWLVHNHLLFSHTAFKRDVHDSQTVYDFVQQVQSVERLRLLLVLTAADIHAVGPGRWNTWKGSLLRQLYKSAEELMTGGLIAEKSELRVAGAKNRLYELLADWSSEEFNDYAKRHDIPYWLAIDIETQLRHARFIRNSDRTSSKVAVDVALNSQLGSAEITFYASDQPGLFASAAGALTVFGVAIRDAKVFTTFDGMALDIFQVHQISGKPFEDEARLTGVVSLLENALLHGDDFETSLRKLPLRFSRGHEIEVEPRVLIDTQASNRHTVIEVTASDRVGLLHILARALSNFGLTIATAQVTTYGPRVVDVFYVKDRFGFKLTDDHLINQLREVVLSALNELAIIEKDVA